MEAYGETVQWATERDCMVWFVYFVQSQSVKTERCASRSLYRAHHLPARSEELDEHITQMLDRIEKLRLVHEQSRKWHERWEIWEPTEAARVQLGASSLVNNENGVCQMMTWQVLNWIRWDGVYDCTQFYSNASLTHVFFYVFFIFHFQSQKTTFSAASLKWSPVSFFFHFLIVLRWSGVQLATRLWIPGSNTQHHLWAFES